MVCGGVNSEILVNGFIRIVDRWIDGVFSGSCLNGGDCCVKRFAERLVINDMCLVGILGNGVVTCY